jgi:transposase
MIQLTPQMRILVATKAVDFRKGIDGLCALCRRELSCDPFSGTVFVFCNKSRTALRILVYDGQGFWLCHKRLSRGRFGSWPPKGSGSASILMVHELQLLLWNGNPEGGGVAPLWKPLHSDEDKDAHSY